MLYRVKKGRREYQLKFAYCLNNICFKPLNMLCLQLAGTYISKEMTNYWIGKQTQCHHTLTPCYTILH